MLNADLLLKNEATSKGRGRKRKPEDDGIDSGFHFIAFVPVENQLWKLDGLERQPMCLGKCRSRWALLESILMILQARSKATGWVKQSLRLKPVWRNTKEAKLNLSS